MQFYFLQNALIEIRELDLAEEWKHVSLDTKQYLRRKKRKNVKKNQIDVSCLIVTLNIKNWNSFADRIARKNFPITKA